jgi:transporter family protein
VKPQIFVLALLTALLWGTAPLFEKSGLAKTSAEVGLAVRSIVIALGVLTVVFAAGHGKELLCVDRRSLAFMAGGAILSGFVGQWIYFYTLKADQASRVVPLIAGVYPLVAAMLAIFFLNEPVTFRKVVGAALVIVGATILRLK